MKAKLFALVIMLCAVSYVTAQNFEGKIVYENSFKSKIPNTTDTQLAGLIGTKGEFFVKGGNYRTVMNGTWMQWSMYVNKDNKVYSKLSNLSAIQWNDGAENTYEVVKEILNKKVTTILGYECDELIFETKMGTQKFYFNTNVARADSKLFEKLKFENWNAYLNRTNAFPLKIIYDAELFYYESTAREIVPMKLNDKLFELPKDVELQKRTF